MKIAWRRWLKRLVIALVLVVLLSGGLLWYVLNTSSGTQSALNIAKRWLPNELTIEESEGALTDRLMLRGVQYRTGGLSINLSSLSIDLGVADILRRQLIIHDLQAVGLDIRTTTDDNAPAQQQTEIELPETLELPFDLLIQRAEIEGIRLAKDKAPLEEVVNRISIVATWVQRRLDLQSINLISPFGELQASGEVKTQQPYPLTLDLDSTLRPPDMTALNSTLQIGGDLNRLTLVQQLASPYNSRISGSIANILSAPDLDLTVIADIASASELSEQWPAIKLNTELKVAGLLTKLRTEGRVATTVNNIGDIEIALAADLTPEVYTIERLELRLPNRNAKTTLSATGSIAAGSTNPKLDLELSWQALQWPLQGQPEVSSKVGRARLTGTPDQYQLDIDGDLSTASTLQGSTRLVAQGNAKEVSIQSLTVRTLGGEISGTGLLTLLPEPGFTTQLKGQGINPVDFLPDWPGALNFNLVGSGGLRSDGLHVEVSELKAGGTLRGYPLNITAQGSVAPDRAVIKQLSLRSGETTINAVGTVGQNLNLQWSVDSKDLISLAPGLHGEVHGKGTASGTRLKPLVTVVLNGEKLSFQKTYAETVQINADYRPDGSEDSFVRVVATQMRLGTHEVERLSIDARGLLSAHQADVEVVDAFGELSTHISGTLNDQNEYVFQLDKLKVAPKDLGIWETSEPASGRIASGQFSLSETCLTQAASRLCLLASTDAKRKSIKTDVTDLPAGLFAHFLPAALKVDGLVSGVGVYEQLGTANPEGHLKLTTSPFSLQSKIKADASDSTLKFAASEISLNLQPDGDAVFNASFPLEGEGGVTAHAQIQASDLSLLERALSGSVGLSIPSLAFVADYIPQLSDVKGAFEGRVTVDGSLTNPALQGGFELIDGVADLAEPGIRIFDVKLAVVGQRDNRLVLTASAKSGGGNLDVTGDIEFGTNRNKGEFKVSGSSFQVAGTPDVMILVSPDVLIKFDENGLNMQGKVLIPKANINLDDLPDTAVRVSKDQVLIDDTAASTRANIPFTARLNVQLGDDVQFSGFGLHSRLQGEVIVIEKPNSPTTGIGEIGLVDGEYEAYGQRLNIVTGRLLFVGGPIDEPGIDLRATRKPTSDLEVGVSARGSLKQPEFTVFSEPALSESERLAYLIFGRPLNAEASAENTLISRATMALAMQGGEAVTQRLADGLGLDQLAIESQDNSDLNQASLVIGKYLSPRLFVSYGIGILEPVSTLKLEYVLNSRWRLITESSSLQSGADAQYVIER